MGLYFLRSSTNYRTKMSVAITDIETNLTLAMQLASRESLFVNSSVLILMKLITMHLKSGSAPTECPKELTASENWQVKCLESRMTQNTSAINFQCIDDQPQLYSHLYLTNLNVEHVEMVS